MSGNVEPRVLGFQVAPAPPADVSGSHLADCLAITTERLKEATSPKEKTLLALQIIIFETMQNQMELPAL